MQHCKENFNMTLSVTSGTYVGWLITMLGFPIIVIMIVLPGLAKRAAINKVMLQSSRMKVTQDERQYVLAMI